MRILIVDDSTYIRTMLRTTLEEQGFDVVGEAVNGESAIDMTASLSPDLITLDNILPDMTGIDILKAFKEMNLNHKVIMISAVGQQSAIVEAITNGASDYLVKPFDKDRLINIINELKLD
jgi:two-component system, chemotaxis family, chemotaxis protein CheY